jgi:hypothetical protein
MNDKFIKTIALYLLATFVTSLINACATVPRESVDLSIELTKMIRSAEKSHLAMLDLFIAERKERANEFIDSTWTPKFMATTVKNTHIFDLLKEQQTDEQKTQLIKEFSEDAASTISERRAKMMQAIDKIDKMLRDRIEEHYNDMLTVNETLTAHIRSAADASETRTKILESLKVDPTSLLPLGKIAGVLDKVTTFDGKVEEMGSYVEQATTMIKEEQ